MRISTCMESARAQFCPVCVRAHTFNVHTQRTPILRLNRGTRTYFSVRFHQIHPRNFDFRSCRPARLIPLHFPGKKLRSIDFRYIARFAFSTIASIACIMIRIRFGRGNSRTIRIFSLPLPLPKQKRSIIFSFSGCSFIFLTNQQEFRRA